ncbi:hypothetical protein JKA74_14430 [Marivirga sp. S37H4]|uniref:Cyclic nucleotide-binding domain-containing protein n=1 Tax=Marivirga aurantiaca TaxID=2802615 RepID=A0A934X068_9BACT|nr:hypothetical protein [Marivirga aurantiaca]MBK6266239.1 hypothetical protein [Marivirga aurantiaca]
MIVNKQTYSNLYRGKLSQLYTIQAILSILSLLCLTSIFLFGASKLFTDDVAYFFLIILLSLLAIIKKNTYQFIYWKIRPKVNIGFFQNITNIIQLIFCSLCFFLIVINSNDDVSLLSFGLFGSTTFMIGMPVIFYSWLLFKKTNQNVSVMATKNDSLNKYATIETYLVIALIALFGIVYDFLPQTSQVLLWAPLVILLSICLVNFILNHFQIKWVLKAIIENKEIINKDTNTEPSFIYEIDPYQYEKNIKSLLIKSNGEARVNILTTIQNLVAIDFLPILVDFKSDYDMDEASARHLETTIDYLRNTKQKVENIKNAYEFVEQSSDIILIRGLLRMQIEAGDKNLIIKLLNDNRNVVKKSACIVAGYHDDINFISILIEHLGSPVLSIWAQFGLKNIGFKSVKYLEIEFSKQKANLFFVEACFEVLSEISDTRAHEALYNALNESNKNIKLIAAKKIIKKIETPSPDKRKYFGNLFDELIINQLTNRFLIKEINKKNETFYQLRQALENEVKENVFLIKSLIQLYYNPKVIEILFSYNGTNEINEHAFSNHLIDLLFEDNYLMRNKVKILFSPNDSRLIELLEEEFPNIEFRKEYKDEESMIWSILRMDYDRLNNWTRACAINTLQNLYSEDIPFELAAEFLNEDRLMKETAAICIYKNVPEFYTIFLKRLSKSEATKLDFAVRSNVDFTTKKLLREDNFLLFDKIQFLMSIPYFKELTINEISTFEPFFEVKVLPAGDHSISINDDELTGYWIIESGQLSYSDKGTSYKSCIRRDIIEVMPTGTESRKTYISLSKPARFLVIEKIVLLNILKYSHKIILNKIGEKSDFYTNLEAGNILNEQVA